MERREFVSAIAALGLAPITVEATQQRPEVENSWAEVPPGATFWALTIFLTDEPIEFTVAVGKNVRTIRGQDDSQRLKESSWRNTSAKPMKAIVRAKALAGDRELPQSKIEYLSKDHVYVAFGTRGMPEKVSDRHGSYPAEAVFIGFMTFD